jgi:hypothetical protein
MPESIPIMLMATCTEVNVGSDIPRTMRHSFQNFIKDSVGFGPEVQSLLRWGTPLPPEGIFGCNQRLLNDLAGGCSRKRRNLNELQLNMRIQGGYGLEFGWSSIAGRLMGASRLKAALSQSSTSMIAGWGNWNAKYFCGGSGWFGWGCGDFGGFWGVDSVFR